MNCPVCQGKESELGLFLKQQPVYQHPVFPSTRIDPPWFKDLAYHFCRGCGHAFLADEDTGILSRLYLEHYYTPRPLGVAAEFQETFLQVADQEFGVLENAGHILEIGCSSGEMLQRIRAVYPEIQLAGFEPNKENARKAEALGVQVQNEFFTPSAAEKTAGRFGLIFHRHVIEHIQTFDDFFKAHDCLALPQTQLVVETPSLNHAVSNISLAPFHIEHRHLFSLGSLSVLMSQYGWILKAYRQTRYGALIGLFDRSGPPCALDLDPVEDLVPLSGWVSHKKQEIARASRGKRVAVWGAGSGGVKAINYFDLDPEVLVDGNPGKAGKVFTGFAHLPIKEAGLWMNREMPHSRDWLIIIASTYDREIRSYLSEYGWQGQWINLYAS